MQSLPKFFHLLARKPNLEKIKVCFCLQKRMSPPVPQTVVIGKKSIWVTNKIIYIQVSVSDITLVFANNSHKI
jgi:hypothetical protein